MTAAAGRYAVLFKAFTCDDFVMRRLARVVATAPSGDVYVMMDETHGGVGPIPFDRVIRYRESDVTALGFARQSEDALFWYNADYPLYYFQHLHPDYDTIVMIEYDAVPNVDIDEMVRQFREQDLDFVGEPIRKDLDEYWWTDTMLHFYTRAEVKLYLICAALFSARAVRHLGECRLAQGRAYDFPDASRWPIGETFVGTELSRAGFHMRTLSSFGTLTRYDWWPPAHESELPDYAGHVFVHPVLVGRRYVKSLFKSSFRSGLIAVQKFTLPGLWRTMRRNIARRVRSSAG